jgi:hypothetical protein
VGKAVKECIDSYLDSAGGPWIEYGSVLANQVMSTRDNFLLWPQYDGPIAAKATISLDGNTIADAVPHLSPVSAGLLSAGVHKVAMSLSAPGKKTASLPEYTFTVKDTNPSYASLPIKINAGGNAWNGWEAGKNEWDGSVAYGFVAPSKVGGSSKDAVSSDSLSELFSSKIASGYGRNVRFLIRTKEIGRVNIGLVLTGSGKPEGFFVLDVVANGKRINASLDPTKVLNGESRKRLLYAFEAEIVNDLLDITLFQGKGGIVKPQIWGIIVSKSSIEDAVDHSTGALRRPGLLQTRARTRIVGHQAHIKVWGVAKNGMLSLYRANGKLAVHIPYQDHEALWDLKNAVPGVYLIRSNRHTLGSICVR